MVYQVKGPRAKTANEEIEGKGTHNVMCWLRPVHAVTYPDLEVSVRTCQEVSARYTRVLDM